MYAVVQQQVPLPLILLLVQQFLCHACLTTLIASTTTSAAAAAAATAAGATATATAAAFAQTPNVESTPSSPPPPQRSGTQIINVQTNCTRDLFEIQLTLNSIFRGLLYTKDFPLECRRRGNAIDANITLRIPTSGCGVRAEPLADGGMEYTVRVMLQMEQKLRQSTDILRTVHCVLPANAMGMTVPDVALKKRTQVGISAHRNARMRNMPAQIDEVNAPNVTPQSPSLPQSSSPSTPPPAVASVNVHARTTTSKSTSTPTVRAHMDTPRVRIWLELGGPNGSGSVEVGVATTLTVRAIVPGTIGVRVVDCAALDGLGESTQQLLDERGCPIDEQVMPALHTRFKPAEEGWSKQEEEDFVEKTFTATFPAFKFPDRERLHVSCGVQLCKGKCPNLNCRRSDQLNQNLNLSSDKHLARIEVFNSLAVTAPQIELERLRYDRRYNMSVEEYAPNVRPLPSEGTLCLSISKLAISFCVLGLIFLIAVIVAITSLIRTRRRARNGSSGGGGGSTTNSSSRIHRTEICTSMFSSSSESAQSARFGSKLFIPYYPNTLPYGRVY